MVFLIIAAICVPMMLIPKPLYLIFTRKEQEHQQIPQEEPGMQEEIEEDAGIQWQMQIGSSRDMTRRGLER